MSDESSWVVVVEADGEEHGRQPLAPGATLVLGRSEDCDLVLPDRAVSGRHLSLAWSAQGARLEDLGSMRGVEVAGQKVKQADLTPGDEARVQRFRIRLVDEAAGGAAAGDRRGELLLSGLGALLGGEGEDQATVLGRMLAGLAVALEADRGMVWKPGEGGDFEVVRAHPEGVDGPPVSRRLLARAQDAAEPLLLTTADTELLQEQLTSIAGELRSIVAAGLDTPEGRRVVYLDSLCERRRFTQADRDLVLAYLETARGLLASDAERRKETRRADRLAALGERALGENEILGESPVVKAVLEDLGRAAETPVSVLVEGESGTGKELAARAVHSGSPRAGEAFVPVNCAALPKDLVESELFGYEAGAFSGAATAKPGLFELADGGTLFLDEVGELPLDSQGKLLRALQEKRVRRVGGARDLAVDFRLVCATNRDLRAAAADGSFREDLFYRISVFRVRMPPLRERGDDVLLLARTLLTRAAREFGRDLAGFTSEAEARLKKYPWPGNVRELRNVVEQSVIRARGKQVGLDVVAPALGEAPPMAEGGGASGEVLDLAALPEGLAEARRQFEVAYVSRILEQEQGNMQQAAARLHLARKSLYAKCRDLGIDHASFRPGAA